MGKASKKSRPELKEGGEGERRRGEGAAKGEGDRDRAKDKKFQMRN